MKKQVLCMLNFSEVLVSNIILDIDDIKDVESFIEKRTKDSSKFYTSRGSFKEIDLKAGALAEVAVYKYLNEKGFSPSLPDFSIHLKKSYSADIVCSIGNIHVKSQTIDSVLKYGGSWVFQRNDSLFNNKLNDYIVLCTVDISNNLVTIQAIIKVSNIVSNNLIADCKSSWHNTNKCALYLEQISKVLKGVSRWEL